MMGFAVNASTIGMAIAGVVVALISRYLNRRHGIWISLAMLAIPTTLLFASAPDITGFHGSCGSRRDFACPPRSH